MSGKGDTPRPKSVSEDQFSKNWDNIFKPQPQKAETKDTEDNGK